MALIWKEGKRVQGGPKELADQLRIYAKTADADEEFAVRSTWHAHIGERLREAADEIERLARSAGEMPR